MIYKIIIGLILLFVVSSYSDIDEAGMTLSGGVGYVDEVAVFEIDNSTKSMELQYCPIGGEGQLLNPGTAIESEVFFIKDHLGSVRGVVSKEPSVSTVLEEVIQYNAYGSEAISNSSQGSTDFRRRFTGTELDRDGIVGLLEFSFKVDGITPGEGTVATATITYSDNTTEEIDLMTNQDPLNLDAFYFIGKRSFSSDISVSRIEFTVTGLVSPLVPLTTAMSTSFSAPVNYEIGNLYQFGFSETFDNLSGQSNYTIPAAEVTTDQYSGMCLNHFEARYFDSEIGLWTSGDKAGQFFSPYEYCFNNPVNVIDPDGNWSIGFSWGGTDGVSVNVGLGNYNTVQTSFNIGSSSISSNYMSPALVDAWSTGIYSQEYYNALASAYFGGGLASSSGGLEKYNAWVRDFNAAVWPYQEALGMAIMSGGGSLVGPLTTSGTAVMAYGSSVYLTGMRSLYVSSVYSLSGVAEVMRRAGASSETIARTVHSARRGLGIVFKSLTPSSTLSQIYERNLVTYGDKLGPTINYLRASGKSWEQIIKSASKPGGKDLGF